MPQLSDYIKIPQEQFVFQFMLPFIIVFAILWGVLTSMKVFERKINLVLAFAMSVGFAFTNLFVWFSTYIINLGSYVALGGFIIIFVLGIFRWMFGRGRDVYYDTQPSSEKLERIDKEIERLYEKREHASKADQDAIDKTLEELRIKRERIKREVSRY